MQKKLIKILLELAIPIAAVILSFLIGSLVILIIGGSPFATFKLMFAESFTSGYGFGQVLQKTTQLIFAGLAVALAFRCGLFNIGAEGQIIFGAFCAGIAGSIDYGLPGFLAAIFCILAAMLGGGIWGGIPGYLKSRFGAHEVITTIMMNFIAIALVNWMIELPGVAPKETVHTYPIVEGAQLTKLGAFIKPLAGSTVSLSLIIAIFACVAAHIFLYKTKYGYMIRAVGLNPNAAETYGINTRKTAFLAMALSGAIAALVGVDFVQGYKHYFELDFSAGIGFMGIAVALLAKNHPLGIIPAAFLFGLLAYGKISLGMNVPKELVEILQAVVILMLVIFTSIGRKINRAICT